MEIVLQSMKALGNLYENYIPQSYLDENGINTIFEILMSKQYNAQIREQVILKFLFLYEIYTIGNFMFRKYLFK